MKKSLILFLAIFPLLTVAALADGVTGCGLGKILWKGEKGIVAHTSADTTNGLAWHDNFAISSGTSECNAESTVQNETTQEELFLAANLDYIKEDISQGNGDFLESYAMVLGCNSSTFPVFAEVMQHNYPKIFEDGIQVKQSLYNTKLAVQSNASLRSHCSNIHF